jgi:hypothetical protein
VGTGQDFDFDPKTASATDDLTDRIRMDFGQDANANGLIDSGEAITVNRLTFVMNQNNAPGDDGDALIRAYNQAGTEVQITGILINGQTLVGTGGAPVPSNDPSPGGNVTATASGLGYELHGLGGGPSGSTADNDIVTIITASGYADRHLRHRERCEQGHVRHPPAESRCPDAVRHRLHGAGESDRRGRGHDGPAPADLDVTLDADGIFSAAVTTVGTNPIDHALSA